ncbi:unnamed protein product [Caenorhabditis nigoni]
MLLYIFTLLCIQTSLALVDSIHNTKNTGDLYPLARQTGFYKNHVVFTVYNNLKTGENISEPNYSTRFGTAFSARRDHMYYGLYWEHSFRDEDNYPDEEAVACAFIDLSQQLIYQKPELASDQSRLEVGKSKTSENGKVRVKCSRFDGHVRRVSEALSGCYYNGTVYRINQEWEEPNPGNDSSLWKVMSCQRSENRYFTSEIVGCSIQKTLNYTNDDNSVVTWVDKREYRLNYVFYHSHEKLRKKCVESEPGVVKIENVGEDYEPVCTVNNVVFNDSYDDDVKGVRWQCNYGRIKKISCKIGKDYHVDVNTGVEHQLPNGCKFICHPQTNFFKCDEALSMFKIEGKSRKMRKYEGWMPGHPKFRFGW